MVDLDRLNIQHATKGNNAAFKRLYIHYAPFVWRIVYRTIGSDKEEAAEVVQETFVRICFSLKSFTGASSLGTWIYRIALNASIGHSVNRHRRMETTRPLNGDLPGRTPGPDKYDTIEFVTIMLDTLPPRDRFLLVARAVDGLTFKELAEIHGKSSASLRTRMSRLTKKLSAMFEYERFSGKAAA